MLKIRLQRIGKKGQAHYKIVVMEHTLKTKGEYLDLLGWYNPHSKELKVDEDKLKKYLADGVQMSPTVNNLFINRKIIEGKKVNSLSKKSPTKKKKELKKLFVNLMVKLLRVDLILIQELGI